MVWYGQASMRWRRFFVRDRIRRGFLLNTSKWIEACWGSEPILGYSMSCWLSHWRLREQNAWIALLPVFSNPMCRKIRLGLCVFDGSPSGDEEQGAGETVSSGCGGVIKGLSGAIRDEKVSLRYHSMTMFGGPTSLWGAVGGCGGCGGACGGVIDTFGRTGASRSGRFFRRIVGCRW